MNFTIIQTNSQQEIVNSSLISKLYDLFIINRANHIINLQGYLYSPSAYGKEVDELNQTYSPIFRIDVPTSGRFIEFYSPATETAVKTALGIPANAGVTETDAANAIFTQYTFAGTSSNPNTSLTDFREFGYFTRANNNPVDSIFQGCTSLTSIDLSNITKTSNNEFYFCDLSGDLGSGVNGDLSLPNIQLLGYASFGQTNISTISDLGTVTSIPGSCFCVCPNLTSVTLPTTVKALGTAAFDSYAWNVSYTKILTTVTGLQNVADYGDNVFRYQNALIIPTSDLSSAKTIGAGAFRETKVTGVLNLPKLTEIKWGAFYRVNKITQVTSLGNITTIPDSCFRGDSNDSDRNTLTHAYLPKKCVNIGSYAFAYRNGLVAVKKYTQDVTYDTDTGEVTSVPDISSTTNLGGVKVFGGHCFEGCSLLPLTLADIQDAETIGDNAFMGTALVASDINLPNLKSIGLHAFNGNTTIQTVSNLGNITTLPSGVFTNCINLQSIVVPTSVTEYSAQAFTNTPIDRVIMHEGVTKATFGQQPNGTSHLQYIELPTTVTDMDIFFHNPYRGGTYGKILVIKATNPPALKYFKDAQENAYASEIGAEHFSAIYVPNVETYQAGSGAWQNQVIQNKLKPISALYTDSPTWWAVYQSGLSNS